MNPPTKLLLSEEAIAKKVAEIGAVLNQHYAGKELTIVMILKGAICLVADLIRRLTIPNSLEFVQGASYGPRGTQAGPLSLFGLDRLDVAGKHILVVDDIYDTGRTLTSVVDALCMRHASSVQSLVLLIKKMARETTYIPDHVLFEIENQFVVGYGLDYKEHYRGLPGVYIL